MNSSKCRSKNTHLLHKKGDPLANIGWTLNHRRCVVCCVKTTHASYQTDLQALSDVIESIVGAIYISDNFSPVGAESLFDNILKPFYDKHITLQTLAHHPTKILFELFQAQGCQQFGITKEKHENLVRSEGKIFLRGP